MKFSRLKEDQVVNEDDVDNGAKETLLMSSTILPKMPRKVYWKIILGSLIVLCILIFISCNKVDMDIKFVNLQTSLNLSNSKQQSLRQELQKVGEMLNIARSNLSRLEKGHDLLRNQEPWKDDVDDMKKDLTDAVDELDKKIKNAEHNSTNLGNQITNLKTSVSNHDNKVKKLKSNTEELSNTLTALAANSSAMSTMIHERLDKVSNDTSDMSVNHESYKDNIYEQLASIDFRLEVMEEEAEQNQYNQESINEDFDLEILKLETALNMTVTHWAELKSGHSEFANKTLGILNSLVELSSRTTSEPNEKEIDNIEAIEDNDIAESVDQGIAVTTDSSSLSGSTTVTQTPVFQNCTNEKKIQPNSIKCEASSEFNRKFGCKKAFDGNLSIGKRKNAWASKGEGVGAWINAKLDKTYAVNQLKILQRHYPGESNKQVEIQFSSGLKQLATLPAKGDKHWNIIRLSNGVLSNTVKITVKEVYGTVNNGFKEIQIFGCPTKV